LQTLATFAMASARRPLRVLFIESGAPATLLTSRLSADIEVRVAPGAPRRALPTVAPAGFDLVVVVCGIGSGGELIASGPALMSRIRRRWPTLPAAAVLVVGTTVLLLEPCGQTTDVALDKARRIADLEVSRSGEQLRPSDQPVEPRRHDRRFDRVLRFIDERYAEPITVDHLARMAHMQPVHFRRQFRWFLGTSVREYVRSLRLARACELIVRTKTPLTDVAFATGFYDLPHFDKTFRKRYGLSPFQFRRRKGPPSSDRPPPSACRAVVPRGA
jgi:AraC-like DNA-binding protein